MQEKIVSKYKKTILSGNYRFAELALDLFRFQYRHNPLYQRYTDLLAINTNNVSSLQEIPYLPIGFYKTHKVLTGLQNYQIVYKSSGTGTTGRSQHYVADNAFYLQQAEQLFQSVYGSLQQLAIVAVLPSYREQGDSSLIAMADHFIRKSGTEISGYYPAAASQVEAAVRSALAAGRKPLVLGVTYALLQIAADCPDLSGAVIMETGGMKGRGRELIRRELHQVLSENLGVREIHSEYGMTELTSQAYSRGMGRFAETASLRVQIRDINDPFSYQSVERTGGINVADLANITSCCFIETQDLGKKNGDGTFEILGRADNTELRGCNLLLV